MRRRSRQLLIGLLCGGGVAAPVIATDAVIGTELDAGAGYDAYQWQSSSDGSTWADISGATAQTYTPTDAMFGLFLRVLGDSAASNATGRVAEVPVQSLGSELIVNGGMELDSNWVNTLAPSVNARSNEQVYEGSFSRKVTATANDGAEQSTTTVNGQWYEEGGALYASSGGNIKIVSTIGAAHVIFGIYNVAAWRYNRSLARAAGTSAKILLHSHTIGGATGYFDAVTVKPVTLNAQLVAPSADMRLTAYYTLPVSPAAGDQVWLVPRISNFANGDYWLILLEYTGTQWNITVYTVASHVRTQRIAATNIGATNGIRLNMNGSSISLETTADSGDNWTSRGTPATNTTYQTATGVNVLHTSAVTAGDLVYEPAV